MISRLLMAIACALFLSGCGFAVLTPSSILQERPFMVAEMKGTVTDATRCVGRYWQKEAIQNLTAYWNVYTYSYEVHVNWYHGNAGEATGLVIAFDEENGKTVAKAYVHHEYSKGAPLRTITIRAMNACKN